MAKRSRKKPQRAASAAAPTRATGDVPPFRPGAGWYVGLFVLALGLRLWYLLELEASPVASLTLGDAESYHTWARELAGGTWIGSEVFYQAPLYPYFLGVQYALFGDSLVVARLSQALLGAASSVLLALAGRHWFTPAVGLLAGALFAGFAPAIFFVGLIQKTTLGVFLLCALLFVLSRSCGELRPLPTLAAGLLLGALALTRENALVLVVPILLWLAVEPGPSRRRRVGAAVCFAAGLVIALAPAVVRNYAVGGELHITTSQMGPNLYIGNNPRAAGYYRPLREGRQDARYERTDAREVAEAALGRRLTPAEVSSFYVEQVVDYVRTQPGDWLRLMGRKIALVWNATEVGDTEDIYAFAAHFPVLRVTLPIHFGFLLPLAAVGVVISWRDRRRLYLLYTAILAYAASVAVFYVFARYRFPLVPMVLLFAALAIAEGVPWFRRQGLRARGAALLLAGVVLVGSNWPMVERGSIQATTHYNLAHGLAEGGQDEAALEELERALRLEPDFAMARSERAVVLARMGRPEAAVAELERSLADDPDDPVALANLGELLLRGARPEEAEARFARAVRLDPDSIAAHSGLARIYFQRRDLDNARRHFERSLALAPRNATAHNNLGVIAAMKGELEAAIDHFEAALTIDPGYEEARKNLARARDAS